jgi:hypothetical protein
MMSDYDGQKDFKLGDPALVCRWRLRDGVLALGNRHMRSLGRRRLAGEPVTPELVAWAKQHVEWSLDRTSAPYDDGVLMLVVDTDGKAAMVSAEYQPLADTSAEALGQRAKASALEAETTGIAPEVLVGVKNGNLLVGATTADTQAGALSFLLQLAETLGITIISKEDLADSYGAFRPDELFLVSDEHGVVAADGYAGPMSDRFASAYERILTHDAGRRRR